MLINQDVFQLEIPMHNSFRMQVADSHCYLESVELHYGFWQSFVGLEYFVKFPSSDKRHHEVKSCLCLEQILHADEKGVVAAEEDVFFETCVLHLLEVKKYVLANRLNRVLFACSIANFFG